MLHLPDFTRHAAFSALLAVPLIATSPGFAQSPGLSSPDGLWTFFDGVTLPSDFSPPTEFAIAQLDAARMAEVLADAPQEDPGTPQDSVAIFLPLPERLFAEVGAQSAPLMEPTLAEMDGFDDIATFRFDAFGRMPLGGHILTAPMLFEAVGYSDGDLLRIEPVETDDGLFHIVYFESNRTDGRNDFEHVTDETGDPDPTPVLEREFPALDPDFEPPIDPVPLNRTDIDTLIDQSVGPGAEEIRALAAAEPVDGTLRVFRLAATTTGEFYQANDNGGGDFDVVISLLQRLFAVNAVFEAELGVRLILALSTLNVLFDDPDTDPFNPGATPCQFRDVQPWIALFFLPLNSFDLGFLFANGGGGGCAWYVVCDDAAFEKSRGAGKFGDGTGLGTFLLLHEIGHQVGARHTYSGTNCDLPNFNGNNMPGDVDPVASAYEPGSGSTIMSYRGLCGPDNVDFSLIGAGTYYNIKSIEQIVDELTLGVGNTCGDMLDFGNDPPDVDAGPDFTIPRETPFTLEAVSASDPDGDPISLTWEQVDLTTMRRDIDEDAGDNPIIRSVPPTGFLDRTIPDIRDILGNLGLNGELLPQMNRTLDFRVTARDNQMAGGGVAYDEMTLTASGDPFFIESPNFGTLRAGCTRDVDWEVGGSGPLSPNVDIFYSSTGGLEPVMNPVRQSFPTTIVAGTPNDGEFPMTVPCDETASARLKVMASSNIFFDVSNQDMTTILEPPVVTVPAIAPGVVDAQCEFTVDFEATVTDDCGVAQGDVEVTVEPTSFNYTLGAPSVNIVQNGGAQVDVSGSVLVSGLLSSPATLRITVDALDNCAQPGTAFQDVSVSDETPPEIDVSVSPTGLWPPNHKLREITATVTAADNCSDVSLVLDSIVSDEPDNGTGIGDGNTVNDIQNAAFGTEDLMFDLRSERDKEQDGRTYTITYEATDGSGNTATDQATVHVPHDQN